MAEPPNIALCEQSLSADVVSGGWPSRGPLQAPVSRSRSSAPFVPHRTALAMHLLLNCRREMSAAVSLERRETCRRRRAQSS